MNHWVKITPPTDQHQFQVMLCPDFLDMSKTAFPEGLRLMGGDFSTEEDATEALLTCERLFASFEKGYAADREEEAFDSYETYHSNRYGKVDYYQKPFLYGKWVMAYTDFDDQTLKAFQFLKLQLHFIDLEREGFSHGISIGDLRFSDSKEDLLKHMKEVDTFMFHILGEYEKQSFPKQ